MPFSELFQGGAVEYFKRLFAVSTGDELQLSLDFDPTDPLCYEIVDGSEYFRVKLTNHAPKIAKDIGLLLVGGEPVPAAALSSHFPVRGNGPRASISSGESAYFAVLRQRRNDAGRVEHEVLVDRPQWLNPTPQGARLRLHIHAELPTDRFDMQFTTDAAGGFRPQHVAITKIPSEIRLVDLKSRLELRRRLWEIGVFCLACVAAISATAPFGLARQALAATAVLIAGLAYLGVLKRVRWWRQAIGVAVALIPLWYIAVEFIRTESRRRLDEVLSITERLRDHGLYRAARERLQKECGDENPGTECVCGLSFYDVYLEDKTTAETSLKKCVAKAIETQDKGWQMVGTIGLADLEFDRDRNSAAAQYYADAARLSHEASSSYGEFQATLGLAKLYAKQGDHHRAAGLAEAALGVAIKLGREGAAAQARLVRGDAAFHMDDFGEALKFFRKAGEYYHRQKDEVGVATVDWMIASVDRKLGRFNEARDTYRRVLGVFQRRELRQDEAEVLLLLADVEGKVGSDDLAMEYYNQALGKFEKLEDLHGQANALTQRAHAKAARDMIEAARSDYERALTLSRRAEARLSEANVLAGLARLATREYEAAEPKFKDLHSSRALGYVEHAERIYREIGSDFSLAMHYIHKFFILTKLGRPEAEGKAAWDQAGNHLRKIPGGMSIARSIFDQIQQQLREQGIVIPPHLAVPLPPAPPSPASSANAAS